MSAPEHAPLPWRLEGQEGKTLRAANGYNVAIIYTGEANNPECQAHRAYLLAAVNSHDKLREALKDAAAILSGFAHGHIPKPHDPTWKQAELLVPMLHKLIQESEAQS